MKLALLVFTGFSISGALCLGQTPSAPMTAKVGVWRSGFFWVIDANGNGSCVAPPDRAYAFGGVSGDIPLTGDWTGTGYASAGIFRPVNGLFILDKQNNGTVGSAAPLVPGFLAQAGDVPVVGDWNGSGTSKPGIYRNGRWYLNYDGNGTVATRDFGGAPGDLPVVGDWTATGASKLGVFRSGYLWVLDTNGNGQVDSADAVFAFGGVAGDIPVVGDWNGDRRTKVGVFRQGYLWVLDNNGDHTFGAGDLSFGFGGISGDIPLVGQWSPIFNVAPATPDTLSVNGTPCPGNGGSCGSSQPGVQNAFTFTYGDPVNGSNNLQYGDVAVLHWHWVEYDQNPGNCKWFLGSRQEGPNDPGPRYIDITIIKF